MSLAPNHMRQQTKRREIYHALGVVDDCKGSLGWAVQCLKKEDPQKWFGLTTSTLSTWYSRYPPKSAARERLMLVNPDGYRDRKDKYAKIKKALKAEVERREELSLMRDRDTMIEWMKVRAKEYADAGDSLYRGFKASVGFFYDTIREEGISLCTEVGKQENPWNGYVMKNQDRFAELSTNHFRLFIKGETHNGQPIDQGIGLFCQTFVNKKWYKLQQAYSKAIDKGEKPKKFTLSDMRIKVMLWADECMKAINKKPEFIKSAWKNTMFPARITGEDDHLYASAPVKKGKAAPPKRVLPYWIVPPH
eukprot:1008767_1